MARVKLTVKEINNRNVFAPDTLNTALFEAVDASEWRY